MQIRLARSGEITAACGVPSPRYALRSTFDNGSCQPLAYQIARSVCNPVLEKPHHAYGDDAAAVEGERLLVRLSDRCMHGSRASRCRIGLVNRSVAAMYTASECATTPRAGAIHTINRDDVRQTPCCGRPTSVASTHVGASAKFSKRSARTNAERVGFS